jgi:hypothetical protein
VKEMKDRNDKHLVASLFQSKFSADLEKLAKKVLEEKAKKS